MNQYNKKIECLGLPATGKSWVLDNLNFTKDTRIEKIKLGIQPLKLFHTFVGILYYKKAIKTYISIFRSNKKSINYLQFIKRTLVSYHRLGVLKTNCKKGILIDEGPMQSVWAIFYLLPITENNRLLLNKLISDIQIYDTIIYISTPPKLHKQRMSLRERKHHIFNGDQNIYSHSRKWMYLILIELRKKHSNIQYHFNS